MRCSRGTGTAKRAQQAVVHYYQRLLAGFEPVLDVGCGKGEYLSAGGFGIDLDADSLRGLRRVAIADLAHDLPFTDKAFGGILAKDVIEHLHDPRQLLDELARVSRTGAKLVLVTPRAIPRAVWADYTHVRGFGHQAIRQLLDDTGWSIDRISRMGSMPLAGRLGLVHLLPTLLWVPGVGHYFGTNWQVIAHRRHSDPTA